MAIIPSGHVSAQGVALSLREVGWTGRIVCLAIDSYGKAVTERSPWLCETRHVTLAEVADLVHWIGANFSTAPRKVVIPTSERFLPQLAERQSSGGLTDLEVKLGAAAQVETICDRVKFYQFVADRHLAPVPRTLPSEVDPFAEFGGAFHLRLRRSWRGLVKLPRGRMIRSAQAFDQAMCDLKRAGVDSSEFVYQELLSTEPSDCVSVCGWHDASVQRYCQTRSLHRTPPEVGCADLVERVDLDANLAQRTKAILSTMTFDGPFELEFVKDGRTGEFKVIELNPRIWLQHRLMAGISGNLIIRRYLGESFEGEAASPPSGGRDTFWVNAQWAIGRLVHLDVKPLWVCRRGCVSGPMWGTAFRTVVHQGWERLRGKILPPAEME